MSDVAEAVCYNEEVICLTVRLRPDESIESLLRRFTKSVNSGGVLKTYRRKRWFISKGEQRRMDQKRGIRRARQQQRRAQRIVGRQRQGARR
ncbi:MAG: 30S ribosomal protein S21 [Chloroflexi bacterium RBG_16_57_9]|nr:MAG: 30S ribosomal protein S21 [Chloroflexi bacterium RBG_16_57_9]